MHDPDHPIWSLLRYAILMLVLTGVLWQNASNFDMTEIKSLITMLIVMTGWGGVEQVLRKRKLKGELDGTL